MRYLSITYIRRPNGKMDEHTEVRRGLRDRDLQTASVILDFRTAQVVKASFDGQSVPREFDRILSYYYQFHRDAIDELCRYNGIRLESQDPTPDPS